jgi:integrase/recombinase XerD
MTPSRTKYIRDLTVRGRAQRTQRAYTRYVSELARYYQRSPELISYEEVTDWLYHLIKERQLSASSVNVAVNAVRFLYGITLGRDTEGLTTSVPHMKHAIRRAEIYARSELEAILRAPSQPRDRAFLMTVYACGLRVSEARDLKTSDIDRARMRLRVRNGKGGKGRVLPLSKRLLKELVDYWRAVSLRSRAMPKSALRPDRRRTVEESCFHLKRNENYMTDGLRFKRATFRALHKQGCFVLA